MNTPDETPILTGAPEPISGHSLTLAEKNQIRLVMLTIGERLPLDWVDQVEVRVPRATRPMIQDVKKMRRLWLDIAHAIRQLHLQYFPNSEVPELPAWPAMADLSLQQAAPVEFPSPVTTPRTQAA